MKIHFYRTSKKVLKLFIFLDFTLFSLITFKGFTQKQELFIPFQGVAKDYSGGFVNQRTIYIDVSIQTKDQPNNILYNELHKTNTDEWGLFSLQIGKGKWLNGIYLAK